jgi:hypothetical protein
MPSRQTGAKPGHERGLSDFSAPATPGDAQQQQQQQQKQQQQQHARGPASPASSTSSAAAAAAAGGRLEVHSSHHHQRCGSGGSGAAAHAHRHAAADAHKPRWVSTFSGPSRQGFSSPEPLTMPPGAAAAAAAALQSARSAPSKEDSKDRELHGRPEWRYFYKPGPPGGGGGFKSQSTAVPLPPSLADSMGRSGTRGAGGPAARDGGAAARAGTRAARRHSTAEANADSAHKQQQQQHRQAGVAASHFRAASFGEGQQHAHEGGGSGNVGSPARCGGLWRGQRRSSCPGAPQGAADDMAASWEGFSSTVGDEPWDTACLLERCCSQLGRLEAGAQRLLMLAREAQAEDGSVLGLASKWPATPPGTAGDGSGGGGSGGGGGADASALPCIAEAAQAEEAQEGTQPARQEQVVAS